MLTNRATVSTSTPGDLPGNNTATSTVRVRASADLSLTKTHTGTDPVRAGTSTTFAVAVENLGPSDAQGPLTVTDTLPAGLSFVSAAAPWRCAPTTGDPQVVVCETPDALPLPAGGSAAPLLLTVSVGATASAGTYRNTATVSSTTPDPVSGNNTDTADVRVVQAADLSVVKTHTGPVRAGDDLTFTLAVANAGPSQASSVVVSDAVPAGLTYVSASGDRLDVRRGRRRRDLSPRPAARPGCGRRRHHPRRHRRAGRLPLGGQHRDGHLDHPRPGPDGQHLHRHRRRAAARRPRPRQVAHR